LSTTIETNQEMEKKQIKKKPETTQQATLHFNIRVLANKGKYTLSHVMPTGAVNTGNTKVD